MEIEQMHLDGQIQMHKQNNRYGSGEEEVKSLH